jgi:hypothetical protein
VLKVSTAKLTYGSEAAEHLSVSVTPEFAGSTPTGKVTVKASGSVLCVISLANAKGSCPLSAKKLAPGSYSLVADYAGSAEFAASASSRETVSVAKARS